MIEAPPSPPPRPIIDIDLPEEQNFLTAPEDDDDADAGGRRSNNRVGGERASERVREMDGEIEFSHLRTTSENIVKVWTLEVR